MRKGKEPKGPLEPSSSWESKLQSSLHSTNRVFVKLQTITLRNSGQSERQREIERGRERERERERERDCHACCAKVSY